MNGVIFCNYAGTRVVMYTISSFYQRDAIASACISCRRVSVCPSVRLSQVGVVLKRLTNDARQDKFKLRYSASESVVCRAISKLRQSL